MRMTLLRKAAASLSLGALIFGLSMRIGFLQSAVERESQRTAPRYSIDALRSIGPVGYRHSTSEARIDSLLSGMQTILLYQWFRHTDCTLAQRNR